MKKILILLIAGLTSLTAFSQKEAAGPTFTFCGKSGNSTMTFDEFKKCKKDIVPVEKNVKIVSFIISMLVVPLEGKDSVFVDFQNIGGAFSEANTEAVDKLIKEKRIVGGKILIEEVKVSQDGTEKKVNGMIIKLK